MDKNGEQSDTCVIKRKSKLEKVKEPNIFDESNFDDTDVVEDKSAAVEDILFRLPLVDEPLIGTPKQVQQRLDRMAIYMRNHPEKNLENQILFEKIHLYMHGFLINIALKQFPYIKGFQTVDIYQEALIALRFKAIPGFKKGKGMSFLNFAKMCIRRHLITILNTSKTRLKDQSMNQAFSMDSCMVGNDGDEDGHNSFSNILPDNSNSADKKTEIKEAYDVTLDNLCKMLSGFEKQVLDEYLTSSSYTEIAHDLGKHNPKKCKTKSIDNALVRIRTKAQKLRETGKLEDIPLFIL